LRAIRFARSSTLYSKASNPSRVYLFYFIENVGLHTV